MQEDIWVDIYRTVNHALADILLQRDEKSHTEEDVDRFAEFLTRGRNDAVKMMWASGNPRYVVGKGRIEGISKDHKYREEHLSRLGQMLDQKTIAAGQKSIGASESQCKQFGLPGFKQLNQSRQRLLLGDCEFDTHIKQLEE